MELCLYIVAVGAIISTISKGMKVIENARTQRAIEEIECYNKANSEFVIRYGALPGLLTKEKCKSFIDFMNYCVKDDTINATTNENLFNNENCDKDIGCLITKKRHLWKRRYNYEFLNTNEIFKTSWFNRYN